MRKLFVIHFSPLELYPPVQNFLRVLENPNGFDRVDVITTHPTVSLPYFTTNSKAIRIHRLGTSGARVTALRRTFSYFKFFFTSVALLLIHRPHKVLYYESLSSWPAYLYKRFFSRASKIFIHRSEER